jgi:hypothetical protein
MLFSLLVLGGTIVVLGPSFGQQGSTIEPISADEPIRVTTPRAASALREVRFTEPAMDDEIARLRQQEENLRRAMEAVARSLEQTKRQLDSIEGAPARTPLTAPAMMRRAVAAQVAPVPEAQARPRVSPPRPADTLPRSRPGREAPLEERLARLEERMSQIAEDLQALRHDLRPSQPGRAVRPASDPNVPLTPTQPAPARRQPRPPMAVPSIEPPTLGDTLAPTSIVPPHPPLTVPSADPLAAQRRPSRNRNVDSDDLAPLPVPTIRATPPAAPVPPSRPAATSPASRSVDERPESSTAIGR